MLDTKDINIYIDSLGASAKKASSILAQAPEKQKNDALLNIAKIIDLKRNDILDQNVKDLEDAKNKQIGDALVDRLELTEERINSMVSGLEVVSQLPDPVGEITNLDPTPSGINVSKMRVPLGVVAVSYTHLTLPTKA